METIKSIKQLEKLNDDVRRFCDFDCSKCIIGRYAFLINNYSSNKYDCYKALRKLNVDNNNDKVNTSCQRLKNYMVKKRKLKIWKQTTKTTKLEWAKFIQKNDPKVICEYVKYSTTGTCYKCPYNTRNTEYSNISFCVLKNDSTLEHKKNIQKEAKKILNIQAWKQLNH